jgi:excisionase family DNA binding protein
MIGSETETEEQAPPVLLLTVEQLARCFNVDRKRIYWLIENEGLPKERWGDTIRFYLPNILWWLEERGRRKK